MNTATAAPRRRCIQAQQSRRARADVSEAAADAIMAAVFRGHLIAVRTTGDDSRHVLLGGEFREVCMTAFTDPATAARRYAVEMWAGPRKVTHDYATRPDAQRRFDKLLTSLNLG